MRLLEGDQEGGLSMRKAPIMTKIDKKAVDAVNRLRLQYVGIYLM